MEIWEERQVGKYGRKETKKQFHYFQKYLNQKGRRSVRRLYNDLKKTGQNPGKKIPQFRTLRSYCHDFNWVDRVNAYDKYVEDLKKREREALLVDDLLEEAKLNHEEMKRAYKQLSYITQGIVRLYEDLEANAINISTYASDMLKFASAYEKMNKGAKLVRPVSDTDSPIFNNVTQVGENHASFYEFLKDKGTVIDDYVERKHKRS